MRVTLGDSTVTEPIIANKNQTPCASENNGVTGVQVPSTQNNAIDAGPAGAFTFSVGSTSGATAPGAAAVASVEGVTIPGQNSTIHIVGPVQASASYACVNGKLQANAVSTLDVIEINGTTMSVPPGQETDISLGGGSYIHINEKTQTSNSLTERVLHVHLQGLADIVVGEAVVSTTVSDPCAGTNGGGAGLQICPNGATLDVVRQLCVIIFNGQTIIVSKPFLGPQCSPNSACIVVPLSKVPVKTPCVQGPGPKYALLVTKPGAHVIGTSLSDRIIALVASGKDRIAGLGGNDCVDGKGTTETVFEGRGNDRIFVALGRNRIAVGNGKDLIQGGTGGDVITAGNGSDTIHGNGGDDRINSGLGHDHIYGDGGKNRMFTLSGTAKVSCGAGGSAFLRARAIPFARKHGCKVVHHLK